MNLNKIGSDIMPFLFFLVNPARAPLQVMEYHLELFRYALLLRQG